MRTVRSPKPRVRADAGQEIVEPSLYLVVATRPPSVVEAPAKLRANRHDARQRRT